MHKNNQQSLEKLERLIDRLANLLKSILKFFIKK